MSTESAAPKSEPRPLWVPYVPHVAIAIVCLLAGYLFARATVPEPLPVVRVVRELPTDDPPRARK